jgi:HPt (histidine-containing phosphotransfer) domain-containing protein
MNSTSEWPQIDGIDSREAQLRYGRHLALFRSTLARLLELTPTLNEPLESPERRQDSIHHAHRLSGTAATLGARPLHEQAKALELLLRAGELGPARAALPALQACFEALRRASQAFLTQDSAPPAGPTEAEPIDAEQLALLCELLRQRKLRASAQFERLAPQLRARLGESRFAALQADLLALRHTEALAHLAALQPGPAQQ